MRPQAKNVVLFSAVIAVLALAFFITSALAPTGPGRAQPIPQASSAPAAKTAGETFKNIQVLKDIPANQLIPSMEFIASSLGVHCEFCHVEGDFSKDTKRPKLTARHMIAMELAINKENFHGHPEVTCYTCHRGMTHPMGVPVITAAMTNGAPGGGMNAEGMNHEPGVNADAVIAKYVEALGGAEALGKITTRVEKGSAAGPGGRSTPVEVDSKAPDEQRLVMQTPNGNNTRVFNGRQGWLVAPGRPPRAITGAELDAMKLGADFHLALDLKKEFQHLRVGRPESIDGRQMTVLMGSNPDHPPVKFYFDPDSGLLTRIETFEPTPLGYNPTQVDFADYRVSDGVKLPFRQTVSQPGRSFTTQFEQVEQNVPIDDSDFNEPAAEN
ncbi:MAG: c-type cytochrome [Acidobacteriota bacterium]|nr:c-type cytochrome [Acidobacteriota bacterium]